MWLNGNKHAHHPQKLELTVAEPIHHLYAHVVLNLVHRRKSLRVFSCITMSVCAQTLFKHIETRKERMARWLNNYFIVSVGKRL